MSQTVTSLIVEHILGHVPTPLPSKSQTSPLFCALQGPQGVGKSTVTRAVVEELSRAPHSLNVVSLSIDDLYLGYDALQTLSTTHANNVLLQGRGLPGTHDIALGAALLRSLFSINHPESEITHIPMYDKSLHDGQGDRVPVQQWKEECRPIDLVLVEGWCLGFYPVSEENLIQTWENRMELGMPTSLNLQHGIDDLKAVNENLSEYVKQWYPYFSCFIQIANTGGFEVIYKWRLQQEHEMKASNGGRGMTDEQVACFIDRYIPGYIFFGNGPRLGNGSQSPPWLGNGLKIIVDENREPVRTEKF